jgi:hypothetical protein
MVTLCSHQLTLKLADASPRTIVRISTTNQATFAVPSPFPCTEIYLDCKQEISDTLVKSRPPPY